nr:hypothetical protein [Tanacetum cinerariifolium]
MKDDEKLRNDDLSICWSLKIKFDKLTPSAAPCRTDFVRTRDHENHLDDDARPEGRAVRRGRRRLNVAHIQFENLHQNKQWIKNQIPQAQERLSLLTPEKPAPIYHSCQRNLKSPPMTLLNQDLFNLKYGNSGPKKYTLSLHKFLAVPFPDDDIEERISRWGFGNVEKYNKDVKYGYANPCPSDADVEYLQLYEEDIEERLKHRDQIRR